MSDSVNVPQWGELCNGKCNSRADFRHYLRHFEYRMSKIWTLGPNFDCHLKSKPFNSQIRLGH